MSSEMVILTRTFDFLNWLLPQAEKFPKVYRHNIAKRLIDAALDFQEAIFLAQAFEGQIRLRHLRQADAHLNMVRLYLRLTLNLRVLSSGQYQHVSGMVAELGRLLGGWIKQAQ
ncbi:MAG: diversity-generating retroelement protein Avd [Anaerolineales bacterium]|nr:diversity-generating retroelement protein Avd [Anaerolineales bacterium]